MLFSTYVHFWMLQVSKWSNMLKNSMILFLLDRWAGTIHFPFFLLWKLYVLFIKNWLGKYQQPKNFLFKKYKEEINGRSYKEKAQRCSPGFTSNLHGYHESIEFTFMGRIESKPRLCDPQETTLCKDSNQVMTLCT